MNRLLTRYGRWVKEMDVIPQGYGVAWFSSFSAQAFCLPVPFNRIAGSFRAWYLDWRRPCEDDPVLLARRIGESVGFQNGEQYGYEKGLRHAAIASEILNGNAISHRRSLDAE